MLKTDDVANVLGTDNDDSRRRLRRWAITLAAGVAASGVAVLVVLWVVRTYAYPIAMDSTKQTAPSWSEPWIHGELLCDSVRQDAGYIKLPNKADGHYFFWFFESRSHPAEDPLVVWLAGGPGCSSLWSLLVENGPCLAQHDGTTTTNPFAWNEHANVIWLDQPLFAGFSYGHLTDDFDVRSTDIGDSLYWFLQGFYKRHPSLRRRQLFLAGEGHAGQFIPVAAHTIHRRNQ